MTADQLGTHEREMAEFLNTAADNLRRCLGSGNQSDEIDAMVSRLPRVLRESARLLARCEAADWPADLQM
jgi:hypothetical protein